MSYIAYAQDLDIYKIEQDGLFNTPNLNTQMTVDEFQLLSRTLRMKDMAYAMIVPGYTHFRAKNDKTGYWILGVRSSAYVMLGYVGLEGSFSFNDLLTDFHPFYDETQTKKLEQFHTISVISLGLIFGTYFYDWIHGQYILSKKQEYIRYRYGMKFKLQNLQTFHSSENLIPALNLTITF